MRHELRDDSRLREAELPVRPLAETVALRPGRRGTPEPLTEKVLQPVPVHAFAPRRKTETWIYVAGALTVLAALLMVTMLVLILTASTP